MKSLLKYYWNLETKRAGGTYVCTCSNRSFSLVIYLPPTGLTRIWLAIGNGGNPTLFISSSTRALLFTCFSTAAKSVREKRAEFNFVKLMKYYCIEMKKSRKFRKIFSLFYVLIIFCQVTLEVTFCIDINVECFPIYVCQMENVLT